MLFSLFVVFSLYTNLFPRITECFYLIILIIQRYIFIVQQSLQELSLSQFFTGIGLGGFNEFFYLATKHIDVKLIMIIY